MSQLALKNEVAVASENALNGSMPHITRPIACSDGPREIEVDGKKINYSYELYSTPGREPKPLILEGVRTLKEALVAARDAMMDVAKKLFCNSTAGVATGAAIVGLISNAANAADLDSTNEIPDHITMGKVPGNNFVEATYNWSGTNYNYHFTCFPIGKLVDIDGNFLKTRFYVPAHGYAASATPSTDDVPIAIYDGYNYFTNRGNQFSNLHEIYRSPDFNGPNPGVNAGDVGVFESDTPVPDNAIAPFAPLGSLQQGNMAFVAGFDRMSTPPTGLLPETGDCSGYNSTVIVGVPQNTQAGTHKSLIYNYGSNYGASNPGGSGSKVVDMQGRIVGVALAVTGTYTDATRATIVGDFTDPAFFNQLAPYAGTQIAPGAKLTDVAINGSDVSVTFKSYGGTNCFVQFAPNLGEQFVDVSPAIAGSTNQVTTNTFIHTGGFETGKMGFYRIRVEK